LAATAEWEHSAFASEAAKRTALSKRTRTAFQTRVKALPGDNTALAAAQPASFYLPAYIGPRGWIALRLDKGKVDWDEVAELVVGSYRLIAPKRLVMLVNRS